MRLYLLSYSLSYPLLLLLELLSFTQTIFVVCVKPVCDNLPSRSDHWFYWERKSCLFQLVARNFDELQALGSTMMTPSL